MRRTPNVKRDTLTDFVLDHVAPDSEVRTDAWTGYDDIGRYRFKHVVSNMSWRATRRASLSRTCSLSPHYSSAGSSAPARAAVSHGQLDYYHYEFTFRFNRRRARHRGLLFYRLLEGARMADPHPYKTLTSESAA